VNKRRTFPVETLEKLSSWKELQDYKNERMDTMLRKKSSYDQIPSEKKLRK
jgi:hypothetical protein